MRFLTFVSLLTSLVMLTSCVPLTPPPTESPTAVHAVSTPTTGAATDAIARQGLTIDFGDFVSDAELTYPAQAAGPFATVILIPGSGPEDMNAAICAVGSAAPVVLSHIFQDIAEDLSAHGYAVLRYNKHYVTGPCQADFQKFYTRLDLPQMLADASQVLATAQANPQVDTKQIFLYGWSEGSTVAAALAVDHPEVAGLIVQGPVSEPWKEIFTYQFTDVQLPYLRSLVTDSQVTTSTLAAASAGDGGLVAKGISLYIADFTAASSGTLALNPFFDKNQDGVIDIERELLPHVDAYLDQLLMPGGPFAIYAPGRALPSVTEQAPQIDLPVLILQGENDANVPVAGTRTFAAALPGASDHTLNMYPGLGHSLGPAASRIDDDFRPIAQAPLDDLKDWLATH